MARGIRLLIIAMVLLCMGAARAPRACIGDGHGHPCSVTTCACDTSCSCHAECAAMAQGGGSHSCCHADAATPCQMCAKQGAPGRHGNGGHLSPPQPQPLALQGTPCRASPLRAERARFERPGAIALRSRVLSPDDPPPRSLG